MNKKQLVSTVAEELNIPKVKAEEALTVVLQGIMAGTIEDEECMLQGFGSFKIRLVEQRNGTNPSTGNPIVIPQHRKIVWKPGKIFKDSL